MRKIRLRNSLLVSAMTGITLLGSASTSSAADFTWRSYLSQAPVGQESRSWAEQQYSELMFWTCSGPGTDSVTVQYHRWIGGWPDADYDDKKFTACFDGYYAESRGEWHDLPEGSYHFTIEGLTGGPYVNVEDVLVDSTAAD